jgi:small multidrug resistance pump
MKQALSTVWIINVDVIFTLTIRFIELGYLYLSIAIIAEVIATSALKASEGFTKLVPSSIVVVGFGVAFYCLSLVLKTLPMGVAYAIWSGLGIVLISIAGLIIFDQKLDMAAIIGIILIVSGVIVMNVFSSSVSH